MSAPSPPLHTVYLDTSVIVAAIIEGSASHQAARLFCESLFDAGSTVVVSDFVKIELAQAAKRAANDPTALSERERRRRRLHRWGDLRDVRADWYQYCFDGYNNLLNLFESVEEMVINHSIIESARDLMSDFQINSYDAIHAATALAIDAPTLATMDVEFLKLVPIPRLTIHLIR